MTELNVFKFGGKMSEAEWVLKGTIPLGHLVLVTAQAGIGKSFWLEALAVSVVHGRSFMGKNTIAGDVLLIDQDTASDDLNKRLNRFALAIEGKPKHKLHVLSMQGLSLKDDTLTRAINRFPDVVLVIIDSLHSLCVGLDTNTTKDMSKLASLKSRCCDSGKTVAFSHHISEKNTDTVDDMMFGEVRKLSMGNSVVNQQADSYYIMASSVNKGQLDKLYIRPVSKRALLPQQPFKASLVNGTGSSLSFEYGGLVEKAKDVNETYVMNLFEKPEDWKSVNDCQEELKGLVGLNKVRDVLMQLHHLGKLAFNKAGPNKYMFCLPENKEEVNDDE